LASLPESPYSVYTSVHFLHYSEFALNLSDPIRSAVPCLHGPVLGALARTTAPLRLTDVHERVGDASVAGVRKVLLTLLDDGLVNKVPGGYVLNREHVAADAVTSLASLHGALVGRIRSWLEQRDEPVVAAGLYGSAARRDGGSDSDIDLVVVVRDGESDQLADELADVVERWTGNRGHVQGLTVEEHARLIDEALPLVASWERDLQPIIGTRRTLLGVAGTA